jgi:hypothetical protein
MKAIALILVVTLNASAAFAYDPQGSGKISNGNCTCKKRCDQFASAGQLAGGALAQCKSDCEQKYAGCNKGAQR